MKRIVLLIFVLVIVSRVIAQDIENIDKENPIKISGTLGFNMMFFDVEGRETNRKPWTWFITGNPTLSLYGIVFPFAFSVSEQQRSFRQPINRFGVSPRYKWATGHFGYRNVHFSPFSLAGQTIAGAGVEINPGKFRFGFMYGRLFRPIDDFPELLPGELPTFVSLPTYKRNAYSVKVGFGDQQNYTDLVILKGYDVPGSAEVDSAFYPISAEENLVLSITSRQQIVKNLRFELDIATSLYTRDRELENDTASTSALRLFRNWNILTTPNSTSYESWAYEAALAYQQDIFGIRTRFRRVEPDFRSMGAYFFQSDVQNLTLEPEVKLWQSKIMLGSSLGWQQDNLKDELANRTDRFISSYRFTFRPSQVYQLDVLQSNYDLNQRSGLIPLDELNEISQTTHSWNITQNAMLAGEKFIHQFIVLFNTQRLRDRNESTVDFSEYATTNLNGQYVMSILKQNVNLQAGYSAITFNFQEQTTQYLGPTIGCSFEVLKRMMRTSISQSFYSQRLDGELQNSISTLHVRNEIRPSRKHRFLVGFYRNASRAEEVSAADFRELKVDLGYAYTF
ncbi:MAG: hypothetical protein ACFCUU_14510 [Cyclobacteriaceae bacterium]